MPHRGLHLEHRASFHFELVLLIPFSPIEAMATLQAKSIPELIQQRLARDHVLRTQIVPCAVHSVVERDSELAEVTQSIACILRLGEEFHLEGVVQTRVSPGWLCLAGRWCASRPPMSAQESPPPPGKHRQHSAARASTSRGIPTRLRQTQQKQTQKKTNTARGRALQKQPPRANTPRSPHKRTNRVDQPLPMQLWHPPATASPEDNQGRFEDSV
jgi:hypothetical protein